jgi:Winged helix DNA-binding domain
VTISERVLNRTTLLRQSLLERTQENVAPAVGRLAGIQAQHANAPHVALWSRVAGFESAKLEGALERRTVVKATSIRSTLHMVAARDYPAFDTGTSVTRVVVWAATMRRAGIDIHGIHQRLLAYAAEPRTVDEMEAFLEELAPDVRLAAHAPSGVRRVAFRIVSAYGGLVHVPPSGFWREHRAPRYVAARGWLKGMKEPSADEALQRIVSRYLGAYGPASVADIGRWMGERKAPRIRKALDALGDAIRRDHAEDGRELVDLADGPLASGDEPAPARFLSRWDSVVIGYDDRTRILPPKLSAAVIKKNADILATFLVDGLIGGTWKSETVKGRGILRLSPLVRVPKAARRALDEEGERLVRFVERDADCHEVSWEQG